MNNRLEEFSNIFKELSKAILKHGDDLKYVGYVRCIDLNENPKPERLRIHWKVNGVWFDEEIISETIYDYFNIMSAPSLGKHIDSMIEGCMYEFLYSRG